MLSDGQVVRLAVLEQDHGTARLLPPGPKHDRIVRELGPDFFDGDLLVVTEPLSWGGDVRVVNYHGQELGFVR